MNRPAFLERRAPATPHNTYTAGCALCHGRTGIFEQLVIDGIGLRAIHADCKERMENMGYTIHPERRRA